MTGAVDMMLKWKKLCFAYPHGCHNKGGKRCPMFDICPSIGLPEEMTLNTILQMISILDRSIKDVR